MQDLIAPVRMPADGLLCVECAAVTVASVEAVLRFELIAGVFLPGIL